MNIRPLNPETDREAWSTLYRGYMESSKSWRPGIDEIVWGWLTAPNPRMYCLFAINEGIPVGFILAQIMLDTRGGGIEAWLNDYYVAPNCRGRFGGKALITAGNKFVKELGCPHALGLVSRSNSVSNMMVMACGYELTAWQLYKINLKSENQNSPAEGKNSQI